jgi:hypothetical protein
MRFEILPGLPPYGPVAISFSIHDDREHREGLVVRFYPKASESWVGNFFGDRGIACNAVLDHPNGNDVIVVAGGAASVIDLENRSARDWLGGDIEEVITPPSLGSIILRGFTDFTAVKADNSGWRSPRISWDGFRNIDVRDTELFGEAYTPVQDAWVPFTLDLLTGRCVDGIYEKEIARAVSFVR